MLLYWGMFTIGFYIGAIFSFIIFAAKKPEEEEEYQTSARPKAASGPTTFVLINKNPMQLDTEKQVPVVFAANQLKES
ncbi:hypothetical protein HYU92_06510 [Candidatus Curtissbacteria bacterium]|nr:hypothetical protein [Candidatus Curtissbacteria bacterium]